MASPCGRPSGIPSQSDTAHTTYFTFKDFLSAEEVATFFTWRHSEQVAKVTAYLDFVAQQPAAAQFTSSSRFGACGTEEGFLPQRDLSLAVAHSIEEIGHEYAVERTKTGEIRPPVLNSRSFYLNWCHAEKQKLMDIRLKIDSAVQKTNDDCAELRRRLWQQVVVLVDRIMLLGLLAFLVVVEFVLVELGAALIALLVAQFKFHRLINMVIDEPGEGESAISMLLDLGAPLLFLLAIWESVMQWKHWEFISGLSIYLFLAVYLSIPVVIALAHAKFWIPARYSELERIERSILERNVKSPFHLLKVAGLGTVFVPTTSSKAKASVKTLVLIHGFAAGNALWACNLDFLAEHYDVYAIEWVGLGRSDRPEFTTYEQEEADRIFVDAIEKWRIAMKAMFASSYAVRYPGHVEHLVLISPAGRAYPSGQYRRVLVSQLGAEGFGGNRYALASPPVPITFMYGGGPDWMDSCHGEAVANTFTGHQRVQVLKVPHAGHQVFSDNVDDFNAMLHHALSSLEKLEAAERRILSQSLGSVPFELTKAEMLFGQRPTCAVDYLGLVLTHLFHSIRQYDSADDFIVQAFEEWRKEIGLEQFNLCAHSMGAIFASSYALRYPDRVNHLVLASPAGVGHPPPPPQPSSPEAEAQRRSWLRRAVFAAWDYGVTPMTLARTVGPYGPSLVQNVLHRRLSFTNENSAIRSGTFDLDDLGEYTYHNWALKASSEKAMTTHLAPIAQARRPLIDVLVPENVKMPITFIYGGHNDWMDFRNGQRVVDRLRSAGLRAFFHLVPYAGHQVFFDNPADFNRAVIQSLGETDH
ncbi:hypothetical protein P43SY_001054 [Pythium insidiosum]|uniref:AB hydrolase-1 domain-containing protein n=1 Tax=Pythium insidiosum TaxID=114742 RepID=A0AAD5Q3D5_PYTIN|nr:hypothetical protein P43SY_001054 [Pythium insidiosum]